MAIRIITFTNDHHIAPSSATTSKCAGAALILMDNSKAFPYDTAHIEKCCACEYSTAKRYVSKVQEFLALPESIGVNVGAAQERFKNIIREVKTMTA